MSLLVQVSRFSGRVGANRFCRAKWSKRVVHFISNLPERVQYAGVNNLNVILSLVVCFVHFKATYVQGLLSQCLDNGLFFDKARPGSLNILSDCRHGRLDLAQDIESAVVEGAEGIHVGHDLLGRQVVIAASVFHVLPIIVTLIRR